MAVQQDVILRLALNKAEYDRVKAGLEGVQRGVGALRTALGTLGVSLSVAGLVAFVKGSADAVSQQKALAESVGLTVSEFSTLNYIARQNEVSQEDLGKALFRVNELLKQGAEEGSKSAKLLEQFGISSRQIRDGSIDAEDALRLIADRFNQMPDGIEKSTLASDLLGTQLGRKLVPMLNLGSQGFDELAQKGEAAGAIMDDKVAAAVTKANDKLSALYQTLQTQVLVGLAALFGLVEATEGDNRIDELRRKVDALNGSIEHLEKKRFGFDNAGAIEKLKAQLAAAQKELDELLRKQRELLGLEGQPPPPKKPDEVTPPDTSAKDGKKEPTLDERANRSIWEEQQRQRDDEWNALNKLHGELIGVNDQEAQMAERRANLNKLYAEGSITFEMYNEELERMNDLLDGVDESGKDAGDSLNVFAEQAARNIQDIVASLLKGEIAGKNFFQSMLRGLADLAAELAAQAALKALFNAMAGSGNSTVAALGVAFGGVKAAGGGYISGPGGPTEDRVPALLSNGEYVIRASAVERWGKGFFDFVNQGLPTRDMGHRLGFASGGLVKVASVSHAKAPVAVNVTNNIDARAADPASTANMLRALQETSRQTEQRIYEKLNRGTAPV